MNTFHTDQHLFPHTSECKWLVLITVQNAS